MQVTIGGNRVGSGEKMKAHLHNYFRSTHNLSEKWVSSMGSGILYPCLVKPAMRGDVFEIGIDADARTIPTKGPLFGSFKMQIDLYQCPIRLYQALLHNNPTNVGLKMSQVKLPLVSTFATITAAGQEKTKGQFSKSCLMKYLGVSGMGTFDAFNGQTITYHRDFNAVPMLAYYDIFKNYYANKQENGGYVISTKNEQTAGDIKQIYYNQILRANEEGTNIAFQEGGNNAVEIDGIDVDKKGIKIYFYEPNHGGQHSYSALLENAKEDGYIMDLWTNEGKKRTHFIFNMETVNEDGFESFRIVTDYYWQKNDLSLHNFELKTIDDMRYYLLSQHELGVAVTINGAQGQPQGYPYKAIYGRVGNEGLNQNALNGLVLKTYQNDIFNNWLNTDWIEGEGSIADLTKVAVVDGTFTMDALNFAQKLYNMLNRVAVTDGTYESWQDVMYEETARKQIESPVYLGGLSQEIMFDEVLQTAPAEGDPLGTIGGRGRISEKTRKGGKVRVKVEEASFIIGIVSLTPRIFYTQGNEFYMTDLLSMDDLHKPGMDGIGYQDLIGERMAWFDTKLNSDSSIRHRSKIGKVPAWIEYMTSVDKAYGDLAEEYGKGYMILNRNYEMDESGLIKDATTYVDPQKYNYAFAYTALDAQNFWVEIAWDIKARRKMSARVIPNV